MVRSRYFHCPLFVPPNPSRNKCYDLTGIHVRRNQPVPLICRDVRHAVLQPVVGGRPAPGPEPAILHLAQRRLHDTDQGWF